MNTANTSAILAPFPNGFLVLRTAALFSSMLALFAATATNAASFIEITNLLNTVRNGTIYVNVESDIELPPWATKLLQNEQVLQFVLTVEIRERRKWLLDKILVHVNVERSLKFLPASATYVVEEADSNKIQFGELTYALEYIGNYRNIPVIHETIARALTEPYVGARVAVARLELPLTAQLESVISGDIKLSSGWYAKDLK